jgi:hypothetical protein
MLKDEPAGLLTSADTSYISYTIRASSCFMPTTCENCPFRRLAEKKPNSLIAKIWKWHTGWCPGWKAYQKSLSEKQS